MTYARPEDMAHCYHAGAAVTIKRKDFALGSELKSWHKRRLKMTVSDLILKLSPFRGNTEIVFTFYCNETGKTYTLNMTDAITVFDACRNQMELYTSDTPQKH